jgi:membrane-associated phospholipid phosphatase
MGDMHYVSDVAVGATVGTLIGLAVPLWHYRRANLAPRGADGHATTPGTRWTLIPVGAGLGVGGAF